MNYLLSNVPNSGNYLTVFMDIKIKGEEIGRIYIGLYRDVFPSGVENFVNIAGGKTCKIIDMGNGAFKYKKCIKRTYEGCKFFNLSHNNYIVTGDIYNNDGSSAGTIYYDQPMIPDFGDRRYLHDSKGLISLVPFKDEISGDIYYDSTFMITLNDPQIDNIVSELDDDQIVIGKIYSGIEVIDKINQLIRPFAGRKYPNISIGKTGIERRNGFFSRSNEKNNILNNPIRDANNSISNANINNIIKNQL